MIFFFLKRKKADRQKHSKSILSNFFYCTASLK
jgi:hypothetical protein